ncbi:MAG: hypothetical protein K1Y36_08925 [Blastocatellia bacterium]|nr:hypothetical protein [Blastocatellia bacterium]
MKGKGLSGASLKILTNETDVTSAIMGRSDTELILKGKPKELNVKPGTNSLTVTVNGQSSSPFAFEAR